MKHKQILELLEKMIMKRWSKNAKTFDGTAEKDEEDNDKIILLYYDALCAVNFLMSFLSCKMFPYFWHTMDEICRILKRVGE